MKTTTTFTRSLKSLATLALIAAFALGTTACSDTIAGPDPVPETVYVPQPEAPAAAVNLTSEAEDEETAEEAARQEPEVRRLPGQDVPIKNERW